MGKHFAGKPCIYCQVRTSTSNGDHVFARNFFPESKRQNLPKVPCCLTCNSEKSKLETYLTAVLPFGARHRDAEANLETMVPQRIAKNQKLLREMRNGQSRAFETQLPWSMVETAAIPFDSNQLKRLLVFIAKGLLWHHWKVLLSREAEIRVIYPTEASLIGFDRLLRLNADNRIKADLGDGAFVYEGAKGVNSPDLSVWKISILGGLKLMDPGIDSQIVTDSAFIITAAKQALSKIDAWAA